MFKKRVISNAETIRFWQDLSKQSREKRLGDKIFQFNKSELTTTIKIKNEGLILNPEIDFLHARILEDQQIIVVETSPLIRRLYIGLGIFIILFSLLQAKNNYVVSFLIIAIFGLIFFYNYRKINQAIIELENALESQAGLSKIG